MQNNQKKIFDTRRLKFLGRITIFAACMGIVNSSIVRIFQVSTFFIWNWLDEALLGPYPLLIVIVPGIGALLASFLFYRPCPDARGEGVPIYLKTIRNKQGEFTPFVGLYKFFAALFVMGFRGSGGFVGPTVAMNAHAGTWIQRQLQKVMPGWLDFSRTNYRLGAICGAAAALGALFKIPLGGGFFAVEILEPANLHYRNLFPAVLSSSIGSLAYKVFYDPSPVFPLHPGFELDFSLLPAIFITALLAGLVSLFFVSFYQHTTPFFNNLNLPERFIPFIGGLLAGVTGLILGREVLGTGHSLISVLMNNNLLLSAGLLFLLGRILTTSFTIGSGGSAGFTFPAIVMGFICGNTVSALFGPLAQTAHIALLVTGMTGVLACLMNIPLAAIIIAIELFGFPYGVPAVIGSVIGFHIGRGEIIYRYEEEDKSSGN
jgi:CIC family chloride channel protein